MDKMLGEVPGEEKMGESSMKEGFMNVGGYE